MTAARTSFGFLPVRSAGNNSLANWLAAKSLGPLENGDGHFPDSFSSLGRLSANRFCSALINQPLKALENEQKFQTHKNGLKKGILHILRGNCLFWLTKSSAFLGEFVCWPPKYSIWIPPGCQSQWRATGKKKMYWPATSRRCFPLVPHFSNVFFCFNRLTKKWMTGVGFATLFAPHASKSPMRSLPHQFLPSQ